MNSFLKGFIAAVGIGAAGILVMNLLKESEGDSNNEEIKDESNGSDNSTDSSAGNNSTPVIKKAKSKVKKISNKIKDSFNKAKDKIQNKIKDSVIINNIKENKNIYFAILAIIAIIISYTIGKVHKPRITLYCLRGGLL